MESTMQIAIIGAGNVGKALGGSFLKAGHDVVLATDKPDNASAAADEIGARSASVADAARGSELIVLAVPYPALGDALEAAGPLDGKIVVDATNPLNADYSDLAISEGSAAEEVQGKFPGARVVKAFNSTFAARQADPVVDGVPVDGFVAGDDESAKATVLSLVEAIGMRPIDAGPLAMARYLEAMAFLNISLQMRHGWSWQSGWKLIGPTSAA
jgi:8-hydroxy-5-deazaflavin:NADPH oxidoreductase